MSSLNAKNEVDYEDEIKTRNKVEFYEENEDKWADVKYLNQPTAAKIIQYNLKQIEKCIIDIDLWHKVMVINQPDWEDKMKALYNGIQMIKDVAVILRRKEIHVELNKRLQQKNEAIIQNYEKMKQRFEKQGDGL